MYKSDAENWPPVPPGSPSELEAELYKAQLEVRTKRVDAEIARRQSDVAADHAQEGEYYRSIFDVAKGAIDRARSGAEMVQKGAGVVGTLYAGALGLAFFGV